MIRAVVNQQQTQALHQKTNAKSAAREFSEDLQEAFQDVNHKILNADQKMAELSTGKSKDIHGTMISMEKADVSLRLLMAVRNKMVNAYEEVMRMQV